MMKIKQIRIVYGMAVAMLAGSVSCSHEIPLSQGEKEIALLATRADDANDSGDDLYKPIFLFLKKGDDGAFSLNTPYLVDNGAGDANNYATTPYNTGQSYPPLPRLLLATGYIPQTLVPNILHNYTTLSLPAADATPGMVDMMAPEAPVTGSATDPFNVPGKTLRFRHLQSRLRFRAILKDDFPTDYRVDSVRITVGYKDLAAGIEWNSASQLYKAKANATTSVSFGQNGKDLDGKEIKIEQLFVYDTGLINGSDNNTYRDLGGVYILPGMSEITIEEISARIYPSSLTANDDKNSYIRRQQNLNIPFSQVLNEGDSWLVTLFFEFDGIELKGQKIEWEKGGNIIIPAPAP